MESVMRELTLLLNEQAAPYLHYIHYMNSSRTRVTLRTTTSMCTFSNEMIMAATLSPAAAHTAPVVSSSCTSLQFSHLNRMDEKASPELAHSNISLTRPARVGSPSRHTNTQSPTCTGSPSRVTLRRERTEHGASAITSSRRSGEPSARAAKSQENSDEASTSSVNQDPRDGLR